MSPLQAGFSGAFQIAYVTADLDRAVSDFRVAHNTPPFFDMGPLSLRLTTPRDGLANVRVAVCWIGAWQIEIIQPIDGAIDIYTGALAAAGDRMSLHHLGMRIGGDIDDWERFREGLSDSPIVLEGGGPRLRFAYVDACGTLGHHLEYVWMRKDVIEASPHWRNLANVPSWKARA